MAYRLLLFLVLCTWSLHANDIKSLEKGKKIYNAMCDQKAIGMIDFDTPEELAYQIKEKNYCSGIDAKQIDLVTLFLTQKSTPNSAKITVPQEAKCPVCGMFTAKYPKWVATITHEGGKIYYFDGVKDMMKFYFDPARYHHEKKAISEILVSDYYTLSPIDAKNAWYVIGSNIYGPMGNEFIPFKSESDAKSFLEEHHGKKIVKFTDIDENMVYQLDQ